MGEKRKPLAEVSANVQRSKKQQITKFFSPAPVENVLASAAAVVPSSSSTVLPPVVDPVTKKKESQTLQELRGYTREDALRCLERLENGYADKSGATYPQAVRNAAGCVLAQKVPNRNDNGYVQIARITLEGEKRKTDKKPLPQNAHRLAVIAYKSPTEIDRLFAGDHASHLCHQPICINPAHIVVESKAENEARKPCKSQGPSVVHLLPDGKKTLSPRVCLCGQMPACIIHVEQRNAVYI